MSQKAGSKTKIFGPHSIPDPHNRSEAGVLDIRPLLKVLKLKKLLLIVGYIQFQNLEKCADIQNTGSGSIVGVGNWIGFFSKGK